MALTHCRAVSTRPSLASVKRRVSRALNMNCRHCGAALEHVFLDLGSAPPSNAFLTAADLDAPESYFPLKLYVCERCWLVHTEDYARATDPFRREYACLSSVSR